jgi:small subunit ribosomal protein S13
VGQKLILGLFNKLGIPLHTRIKDMNSFQISQATSMLETLSTFEDLIRFRIRLLKLHRSVGTYRGIRLRQGLPRNGQRTHSNAKNPRKLRGRIF